jgi:hypothetical protein
MPPEFYFHFRRALIITPPYCRYRAAAIFTPIDTPYFAFHFHILTCFRLRPPLMLRRCCHAAS